MMTRGIIGAKGEAVKGGTTSGARVKPFFPESARYFAPIPQGNKAEQYRPYRTLVVCWIEILRIGSSGLRAMVGKVTDGRAKEKTVE